MKIKYDREQLKFLERWIYANKMKPTGAPKVIDDKNNGIILEGKNYTSIRTFKIDCYYRIFMWKGAKVGWELVKQIPAAGGKHI